MGEAETDDCDDELDEEEEDWDGSLDENLEGEGGVRCGAGDVRGKVSKRGGVLEGMSTARRESERTHLLAVTI